jgi:hypothetical protein
MWQGTPPVGRTVDDMTGAEFKVWKAACKRVRTRVHNNARRLVVYVFGEPERKGGEAAKQLEVAEKAIKAKEAAAGG